MKRMLSEIKNRAEFLGQLAELLAEMDKYPSAMQRDVYALIDPSGRATAAEFYEYAPSYEEKAFIYSRPAVYESLLDNYYQEPEDFSNALEMNHEDFEKLVKEWIKLEDGEVDEDYKANYYDCFRYAENNPEVYQKLEDVARATIDDNADLYKEVAEKLFIEAIENERDELLYA